MSVVVSSPQQICNNPLNRSKTKSLYSFPKSQRFKSDKNYYCDQFYDLPSTKTKRVCNLGYSTKYDFTKGKDITPAPNVYSIPTDVEKSKMKKTGFSFGEGRDVCFNNRKLFMVLFFQNSIILYQDLVNILIKPLQMMSNILLDQGLMI